MSAVPVSAVMIVRDAARTLDACLASLAALPEVVVYDNGSTDDTVARARAYPNVVVHTGPFLGFGPTKARAAGLASRDWILAIDADESVSPELMRSVQAADFTDPRTAYAVHRRNFFMGREVRHSGWSDDWLLRLYNRAATNFDDAPVHEKVPEPPGGRVVRLQGALLHSAVAGIGDFLVKVNRYSEIRRAQPLRVRSTAMVLARSFWAFFRTLVLRRGFLDGWRGVVIAVSDANGAFFKFMKPLADERVRREAEDARRRADGGPR
jgi:glycosyltransferase involved in cell wall biosynthesis